MATESLNLQQTSPHAMTDTSDSLCELSWLSASPAERLELVVCDPCSRSPSFDGRGGVLHDSKAEAAKTL